jgi:hypothetical protein
LPYVHTFIPVYGLFILEAKREREGERESHLAYKNFIGMRTICISSIEECDPTIDSISDELNHL